MLRVLPPVIEPQTWILAFHRASKYRLVRWLAFGRYKHVSAFAWVDPLKLWVYYDVTLDGTHILMLPDSQQATQWIADRTADADLVTMRRTISLTPPTWSPFYCVCAVKHLLGLRCGALRPTSLYRWCLAHGGELIHGAEPKTHDRSGDPRPAAAGAHG